MVGKEEMVSMSGRSRYRWTGGSEGGGIDCCMRISEANGRGMGKGGIDGWVGVSERVDAEEDVRRSRSGRG